MVSTPSIKFNAQAFAAAFAPLMAQGAVPTLSNNQQQAGQPVVPTQQPQSVPTPVIQPAVITPAIEDAPVEKVKAEVVDDGVNGRKRAPATTAPAKRHSIPEIFQHLAEFPNWIRDDLINKLAKKQMTLGEFMDVDPSSYKKPAPAAADDDKKSQVVETPAEEQQTPSQHTPTKKPKRKEAQVANSGPKPFDANNFVVDGATQPVPVPQKPQMMVGPAGTPYMGLTHGSVWVPKRLYHGYDYPDCWDSFNRRQKSEYLADLFKQDGVIQAPDPTPGLDDTARLNELATTIAFQSGKTLNNLSHEELLGLQRMIRSSTINMALQQAGYKYPESGFAYFMESPKRWYTNDQQELQFYDWAFEVSLNDAEGNKTENCLVIFWKATPDFVAEVNGWVDQHVVFRAKKVQPKNA